MSGSELPELEIVNRQRRHRLDLHEVKKRCALALPLCVKAARHPRADLASIDVSIISDRRIARVHRDFMDIGGPTDVITFPYGEIVVSADTAHREGPVHNLSTEQELMLYIIHGFLHLHGWNDLKPEEAKEMHICQYSILNEVIGWI